ncbi:MAG TPA: FlgD immunoglobulin-like domain containing protein [Candidatus Limnocylindrales bacterium]
MRRPTPGLLIGLVVLVASLLSLAPLAPVVPVAAAASPKVAIIVGPAGANTAKYRADADQIAAAALRYTPNVVQVYTPNATWAAARQALEGASIVVYMGHGNGFPSPYRTTLWPATQDGLGLNPVAGVNDSTTQYFGESVIASEVRLAPDAFVLLAHLCYASGNSEPGYPEPSLDVARQRVDNFAVGFLAAGARAVVASAYYGGTYYVESLFTTDLTVDQIWQGAPGANANVIAFPSVRTPGMAVELNPDGATGRYLRSLTGRLDLRASHITGGQASPPPPPPPGLATLAVPGDAVAVDGAGVYQDPGLSPDPATGSPPISLPAGTRVHLDGIAGTAPDGSTVLTVTVLDRAVAGFMSAATLQPAGAVVASPRVLTIADGGAVLSPNGDGRSDAFRVTGDLSTEANWQVTFGGPSGVVASVAGFGSTFDASWDGTVSGVPAPDGRYSYSIAVGNAAGLGPGRGGSFVLDTVPPALTVATSAAATTTFAPNGDGIADQVGFAETMSEAGWLDVRVTDAAGMAVRTTSVAARAGSGRITWDGRSDGGAYVGDGRYTLVATPRDAAGNVGGPFTRQLAVFTALSSLRASPVVFLPGAAGAPSATRLSVALARPVTVTWTVTNAADRVVVTQFARQPLAPGEYAFVWNGRDGAGNPVPRGTYYSSVRASDGSLALRLRAAIVVDAFSVALSDATPSRGQSVTVTASPGVPLVRPPRLTIAQPGAAPRSVTMTASGTGYRAAIRLASGQPAGRLQLTISGTDRAGTIRKTTVSYPLG